MSKAERDVVGKAIEHLDRGEDQEAAVLLGPHVVRNPADIEALYRLGVAFSRTHRLEEAVRIFARVVELDPQHGRAVWNLGRARLVMDDPLMAEPLLRLALRLAPDEREISADLAVALRSIGRARDARDLLAEACRRFPEDVYMKARLLAVEIQDGATEAAARTADRLEALHPGDAAAAAASLQWTFVTRDAERARRAATQLWSDQGGAVLEYEDLLRSVAEAFPPRAALQVRSGEEALTCPACGVCVLRSEVSGIVLGPDVLERLAAVGSFLTGNRCACGLELPRAPRLDVLYPELSLALRVDLFPSDDGGISDVEALAAGRFGEGSEAAPRAEVWYVATIAGPSALSLALCAWDAAHSREASLPEIGELGRAERRARETIGALRALAGADDEPAVPEDDAKLPLPDWMRAERESLLATGIDCGPWPLDHVCRCGADLMPFLFGSDRTRRWDAEAIDAAAVAGRAFRDHESGERALGFNCDACGRLHTWVLGVTARKRDA
jgi:tetratricopeptide (TPR) repeat protein